VVVEASSPELEHETINIKASRPRRIRKKFLVIRPI